MIKLILKENDIKIIKLVNVDEFDFLEEIGVNEDDTLSSSWSKINHHICNNHHKGAICMVDEEDLSDREKLLIDIRKKLKVKKHI